MNKEMINVLVRQVLLVVFGWLALRGFVPQSVADKLTDANTITAVVGALTTLATIIWGLTRQTDAAKVKAADGVAGVAKIEVTDTHLAEKVASPTVRVVKTFN